MSEKVLATNESGFRIFGGTLLVIAVWFSASAFFASMPVSFYLIFFSGVMFLLGFFLFLQVRRKKYDDLEKNVVSEWRWLWSQAWKRSGVKSIDDFKCVDILMTATHGSHAPGASYSIAVRVLSYKDNQNVYPGKYSWVLEVFCNDNSDSRRNAMDFARLASKLTGLEVVNRLDDI